MKEHLVALCYILLLAGVAFALMAKPMTAHVMQRDDFVRRRNTWVAVTLITFFSHNFWLAMLLCGVAIAIAARREHNVVALYCALLFAVPQFQMSIEGIGAINRLFEIDHPRMLAIVLLAPAAVRLLAMPRQPNPRLRAADLLFGAYFGYVFLVNATADSVTGLMRWLVYATLDQILLYYVVTRSIVSRRQVQDVLASFVMGLAVMSVIAVFEFARSWLVYESLRSPLGVPPPSATVYIMRIAEGGGYLRAMTTTGNAIAMGFMAMIAILWQLALARHYRPKLMGVSVVLMLVGGLLATFSRGPWLGCAIALVIGLAMGPHARKRLTALLVILPLVAAAVLLHPQGNRLIDLLPFVGSVEPGSVTYRTRLIEQSMIVFWQHPIFGSLNYIQDPAMEVMRQGQGIIDIVNSYIGVALAYGTVGLILFVAPSAWALVAVWIASRRMARHDPEGEAVARALAASLLAVLLAIGAVSHYFQIPIVHWMIVALCFSVAAHSDRWRETRLRGAQPQGGVNRSVRGSMPDRWRATW